MKKIAVLINFFKPVLTESEILSLRKCIYILSSYDLILLGPKNIDLKEYEIHAPGLKTHLVDSIHFKGNRNYCKFLMSETLYKNFEKYDAILIYQLDCLVFKDELSEWVTKGYDFIGAPIFENYGANDNYRFLGVGNGGFSLRNPKKLHYTLKNWEKLISIKSIINSKFCNRKKKVNLIYSKLLNKITFRIYHKPLNEIIDKNEDLALGIFLSEELNLIRVPKPEEALKFSMEVHPEYLYEKNDKQLPFGCHAWERYEKEFWINFI